MPTRKKWTQVATSALPTGAPHKSWTAMPQASSAPTTAASSQASTKKTLSPLVGSIFTFNLVIGAGCLTIPKSFAEAGIFASVALLLFLMIMGYTTVTFMVEAMALSNYLLRTDEDGNATDHNTHSFGENFDEHELHERVPLQTQHNKLSHRSSKGKFAGKHQTSDRRSVDEPARLFQIDLKVEMSSMAEIFLHPAMSLGFYVVVIGYLIGDLAIYSVASAKSLRDLLCSYSITTVVANSSATDYVGTTSDLVSQTTACAGGLDRDGSYWLCLVAFLLLTAPWVFFDISNLGCVQIVATVVRYTGLGVLIAVSFFQYFSGEMDPLPTWNESADYYYAPAPAPFPKTGESPSLTSLVSTLASLQALFGVSLYSFMSHHSLPSILTPVLDPKHQVASVYLLGTYMLIVCIYITMGTAATLRFPNPEQIQDLYTLNFVDMKPRFVGTFLVLFPVIVMMSSFPIIGITLRENLCELWRRVRKQCKLKSGASTLDSRRQSSSLPTSPRDGTSPKSPATVAAEAMAKDRSAPPDKAMRTAMAIAALLPVVLISVSTENVGLIVAVTGSLFGALIQWFYPAILVFRARQECQVRLVRQAANPWHSREIDSYNESSGTTANGMSSSKDDKVDQTESTNRSKRAGGSRGSHTHQKVVPTSINAVSLSTEEREPDMAGILQSSDVAVVSKVNPYASVCSCGICAVFVIVWSLLSVGFGIHHLFTATSTTD